MAHEEDVKQKVDNDSTSEEILCNADDSATLAQLSYSVRVSSSQSAPQASFMVTLCISFLIFFTCTVIFWLRD